MRAASRSRPRGERLRRPGELVLGRPCALRPAIRLSSSAASVERRRRRGTARVVAFCAVLAGLRAPLAPSLGGGRLALDRPQHRTRGRGLGSRHCVAATHRLPGRVVDPAPGRAGLIAGSSGRLRFCAGPNVAAGRSSRAGRRERARAGRDALAATDAPSLRSRRRAAPALAVAPRRRRRSAPRRLSARSPRLVRVGPTRRAPALPSARASADAPTVAPRLAVRPVRARGGLPSPDRACGVRGRGGSAAPIVAAPGPTRPGGRRRARRLRRRSAGRLLLVVVVTTAGRALGHGVSVLSEGGAAGYLGCERDDARPSRAGIIQKEPGGDLLSQENRPPSTIGAGGLNCRVRNGNGCDPAAMATGNLSVLGRTRELHSEHETSFAVKGCDQALGRLVPVG